MCSSGPSVTSQISQNTIDLHVRTSSSNNFQLYQRELGLAVISINGGGATDSCFYYLVARTAALYITSILQYSQDKAPAWRKFGRTEGDAELG